MLSYFSISYIYIYIYIISSLVCTRRIDFIFKNKIDKARRTNIDRLSVRIIMSKILKRISGEIISSKNDDIKSKTVGLRSKSIFCK
jgi:hypothetical protein